jgi:hypothetical protein
VGLLCPPVLGSQLEGVEACDRVRLRLRRKKKIVPIAAVRSTVPAAAPAIMAVFFGGFVSFVEEEDVGSLGVFE